MAHFMTVDECAELLRVTPRTIARYVRDYGMPHVRIVGVLRFEQEAVLRWAKSGAVRTESIEVTLP